jgi:hypothetical protein
MERLNQARLPMTIVARRKALAAFSCLTCCIVAPANAGDIVYQRGNQIIEFDWKPVAETKGSYAQVKLYIKNGLSDPVKVALNIDVQDKAKRQKVFKNFVAKAGATDETSTYADSVVGKPELVNLSIGDTILIWGGKQYPDRSRPAGGVLEFKGTPPRRPPDEKKPEPSPTPSASPSVRPNKQ